MRRITLLLSVVAVGLGLVMGMTRSPAVAQEATPTGIAAMSTHPVVGTWQWLSDVHEEALPSLGIFHADGTYIEVFPDGSILLGLWQPTGARTADNTVYSYYLVDDQLVRGEGRFTVEVDATGTTMTSTGTFVGRFVDGSVDFAIEEPATATRLGILPVLPLETLLSTPAAGTPEAVTSTP